MVDPALFSSATDEWETPDDLFQGLHAVFKFTRDVCATAENAKRPKYWTKADDALSKKWRGVCWCNPPYGEPENACPDMNAPLDQCKKCCQKRGHHNPKYRPGIGDWVKKAATATAGGATVVMLLPARTDTRWFHQWIWCEALGGPYKGVSLRFIRGRLRFGGAKNSAPFPSMIVVFRKG